MALYPDDPPTGDASQIPSRIPEAVRRRGLIIDLDPLRPGDVILFKVIPEKLTGLRERWKERVISKLITGAQKAAGYSDANSAYSHSAIFLGMKGMICEANFEGFKKHGVGTISLLTYCDGKSAIRVRRYNELNDDADPTVI